MNYKHLLLASLMFPATNSIHAWTEQEVQEHEERIARLMLPKIKPGTVLTRAEEIQALEEQIAEDEKTLAEVKEDIHKIMREDSFNPQLEEMRNGYINWKIGLRNMKNKLKRLKQEEALDKENRI